MDQSPYISGLFALAGALVGGSGQLIIEWLRQRSSSKERSEVRRTGSTDKIESLYEDILSLCLRAKGLPLRGVANKSVTYGEIFPALNHSKLILHSTKEIEDAYVAYMGAVSAITSTEVSDWYNNKTKDLEIDWSGVDAALTPLRAAMANHLNTLRRSSREN